jgi:type II secretory pathway pseudopilin PulG
MQERRRKAFTLVELLIIVAIISLLVALLTPVLRRARELANEAACASQQHQIALAVTNYAVGNRGKYPPPAALESGWWWSVPNPINYYADTTGDSVGRYLRSHLPSVDVFICPSSGASSPAFQEKYESPDALAVLSSYFLLWNYRGWGNTFVPAEGLESSTSLLVSDQLWYYNGYVSYTGEAWFRWITSHPFDGASLQRSDKASDPILLVWLWKDDVTHTRPDIPGLNSAYRDGHVEKFGSRQAQQANLINASQVECYFPAED